MIIKSVQNRDIFEINDEAENNIFYGCDQDWYPTEWQRRSGCGPTTITNIMHYLDCSRKDGQELLKLTKSEAIDMMEDIWQYVTPTHGGISSTKMLHDYVMNLTKAKDLNIGLKVINVPANPFARPKLHKVLSFIEEALSRDTPVAFLNLNNGSEKQLYSWHWVTLISFEYEENENIAKADILDEGLIKKIDLAQWLKTTTLGGGFISFDLI